MELIAHTDIWTRATRLTRHNTTRLTRIPVTLIDGFQLDSYQEIYLNLPFNLVENNKKVQIFEEIWFVFHVGGSLQGFIKTIKLRSCIGK